MQVQLIGGGGGEFSALKVNMMLSHQQSELAKPSACCCGYLQMPFEASDKVWRRIL